MSSIDLPRPHLVFVVTEDWYFVSHRLILAKNALTAGYQVSVITRINEHADIIRSAGIGLIDLPARRAGLGIIEGLAYFGRLIRLYRNLKPDLIHHVAIKPVIFGGLAAKLVGISRVVNALGGLGFVFTSSSIKAKTIRPVVSWLLRTALSGNHHVLILQNNDDSQLMIERKLVKQSAIRIIRGVGINPDHYHTEARSDNSCMVILPARMLKDKGVHEFVDAARQLKQEGIKARFVLVGSPDPENPASLSEDILNAWVSEQIVEYWGWRDDMKAIFAQSDIVCLPSYREGLPKALLEAAASSKPIVTTDAPGCREVVTHGFNGLLVPIGNSAALASALRTLITDPVKRQEYGKNSRTRAESEFNEANVLTATLRIYHEILNN